MASWRAIAYSHDRSRSGSRRTAQLRRRGHEHVLDAVRGGLAVPQHSHAEVEQPVGIAVVDRAEGNRIAVGGGAGEFAVVINMALAVPAVVIDAPNRPASDCCVELVLIANSRCSRGI